MARQYQQLTPELETVVPQLVSAMLHVRLRHLQASPETWQTMCGQIAESLLDAPHGARAHPCSVDSTVRVCSMTESRPSREELMQEGQSLVHALAVKIHRNLPVRVDLDDLVAYGEIGLAEAARDYDASFGAQFTTFAYYRVRGAIYDGLAKMTWTSRARYRRLHYERLANEALAEDAARSTNSASPTLEGEAVWFRNMTETLAVVYLSSQSGDAGGIHESAIADPRTLGAHSGGPAGDQPEARGAGRLRYPIRAGNWSARSISTVSRCNRQRIAWESASRGRVDCMPRPSSSWPTVSDDLAPRTEESVLSIKGATRGRAHGRTQPAS